MTTVDDSLAARAGSRLRTRPDALPIVLLGVLLLAAFLTIVLTTRDYVLYADDWAILELRYQGGIDSLLEPYNGHLMAVSVFVFKVLARVAGLDVHWPYMVVLAAGHVA